MILLSRGAYRRRRMVVGIRFGKALLDAGRRRFIQQAEATIRCCRRQSRMISYRPSQPNCFQRSRSGRQSPSRPARRYGSCATTFAENRTTGPRRRRSQPQPYQTQHGGFPDWPPGRQATATTTPPSRPHTSSSERVYAGALYRSSVIALADAADSSGRSPPPESPTAGSRQSTG